MSIEGDLEVIARQERELRYLSFDAATAWRLGTRLREIALARSQAVVIDVRRFGCALFFCALEGTSPDNAEWVRRKSNVVERYRCSSYAMGHTLLRDAKTLTDRYGISAADFAAHGGSFPLYVRSAGMIGSVTVSGLPQRDDHELVVEGLCAELGFDYAAFRLPA